MATHNFSLSINSAVSSHTKRPSLLLVPILFLALILGGCTAACAPGFLEFFSGGQVEDCDEYIDEESGLRELVQGLDAAIEVPTLESDKQTVQESTPNVAPSPTPQSVDSILPPPAIIDPTGTPKPISPSPILLSLGCLSDNRQMVAFEFGQTAPDGYTAQIGGKLYAPTFDPSYPTRLFFIGVELPLQIPATITLISDKGATHQTYQSYFLPDCRELAEPVQIPVATLTAIPFCPEGEFYNSVMDRCWPIKEPQPNQPSTHEQQPAYQPPTDGDGPEPTVTPGEGTEPTPTEATPGEETEPTPTEGTENPDVG